MKKYHEVKDIKIECGVLKLIVDGKELQKNIKELSSIFANAPDSAINVFEVSPSGYGIYWPLLDEDISIDGILGISHRHKENSKIQESEISVTH